MKMDGNMVDMTVMYNVADAIIKNYKDQLEKEDAVSSGSLLNSIDYEITQDNDGTIKLTMIANDYWWEIEYGRGKNRGEDTWADPEGDISRWIINKIKKGKFIPKPGYEIPTTQSEIRQTANAIVWKIGKVGYKGKKPLEKSLEKSKADGLIEAFANSFIGAYAEQIKVELVNLEKSRPKYRHE